MCLYQINEEFGWRPAPPHANQQLLSQLLWTFDGSFCLCPQNVDGVSAVDSSLKRVAVVEDFFDIIYSMHVEIGGDTRKAPKHAGQKKTYKAVSSLGGTGHYWTLVSPS